MEIENLKMGDLYIVCDKCKGQKNITETFTRGSGLGSRATSYGPCDMCNGIGGHLTDLGKVLKGFIQKVNSHQV